MRAVLACLLVAAVAVAATARFPTTPAVDNFVVQTKHVTAMDAREAMRQQHFLAVDNGDEDLRIAALTQDWTEADFARYGDNQLSALQDLFTATNGPGWTNSSGWSDPNNSNPCGNRTSSIWYGLKCSGTIVTTMSLQGNGLGGILPDSFTGLPYVSFLDLTGNSLIGPIPPSFGNMTTMQQLNLGGNGFSGTIPDSISTLGELFLFYVGANNLNGNLPSLWNCQSMKYLMFTSNHFSGTVPASYANLPLGILDLGLNNLSGMFPVGLCGKGIVCSAYGNQLSCPNQECTSCDLPTCNCQLNACLSPSDCAGGLCTSCGGGGPIYYCQ